MQQSNNKRRSFFTYAALLTLLAFIIAATLSSFTIYNTGEDLFKQLGIGKTEADQKIQSSILGGYLDQYGVKNAKNIAVGNRAAVTKDLLAYTKKQVSSPAFTKGYQEMRENMKPKFNSLQTPEQMQAETVAAYRKSLADLEAGQKKADASMKAMYDKMVEDAKKQLKDAEDPNNKSITSYRKNYAETVKSMEAGNKHQLELWEAKYPANQMLFVKMRLQQFLEETKDIDFNAKTVEKNGKRYFEDRAYESKGNRWKMGYRAGKEVIETARQFVTEWEKEIQ